MWKGGGSFISASGVVAIGILIEPEIPDSTVVIEKRHRLAGTGQVIAQEIWVHGLIQAANDGFGNSLVLDGIVFGELVTHIDNGASLEFVDGTDANPKGRHFVEFGGPKGLLETRFAHAVSRAHSRASSRQQNQVR